VTELIYSGQDQVAKKVLGVRVIAKSLITHGLAADTPIALIEQGTTPRTESACSNLANHGGLTGSNRHHYSSWVQWSPYVKSWLGMRLMWLSELNC